MSKKQEIEASSFIPHRPPMLLIKTLHEVSSDRIEADFEITSECLFLREDDSLEPSAYIEILAQSFAAGTGFLNQEKAIKWGYLAAMRGVKIFGKVFLGDTLNAIVCPITEFEGIIVVEGELFCKEKKIASAQFKVYVPDNNDTKE